MLDEVSVSILYDTQPSLLTITVFFLMLSLRDGEQMWCLHGGVPSESAATNSVELWFKVLCPDSIDTFPKRAFSSLKEIVNVVFEDRIDTLFPQRSPAS